MRVGWGKPPARRPRLTAEERAYIIAQRAQGLTLHDIVMLTGRSEDTVKAVLRKARAA